MMDTQPTLEQVLAYLTHDPDNRELLATAIDLHLALGQPDAACQRVGVAMARYPHDPFFRHRFGNVLIAQGKLSEAEAVFTALDQEFSDANIAYNLAYVYFRQGRYGDAKGKLMPYVDVQPLHSRTLPLLLRTLHHLGEIKQAVVIAQRYLEAYASNPDFLGAACLLYLDDGQLDMADKLSRAAQSHVSPPFEALVVCATVALGQGALDKAQAQFSQATECHPVDGRSWAGLGLTSLLKQDISSAEKQLERATTYLPTHIGTLHALGWCKLLKQDIGAAETIFNRALSLNRNFGESHGGLAVVAALKGDATLANACIERALRLDAHGLAARYAQIVLSDKAKNPTQFSQIAFNFLADREGPFGNNLAQILLKWSAQVASQKID